MNLETKNNINLIVYHIYCVNNYLDIVKQQLARLQSSGLYDWCDKLEITCINTEGNFDDVEYLVKDLDKVNLNKYINNSYEYNGITKVWEYSQAYSGKVLYFHTKGVSNFYTNVIDKQISKRKVKGISWWKEIMEYYLIDNYKDCLDKLNTFHQCGVTNSGGWWWGNFWWADLLWVRDNSKPIYRDRWYYEAWLNHGRLPSHYEFYHFEFDPYYTDIPDSIYKNPSKYSNSEIKLISAFYGTLGEQQDEGRPIVERMMVDVTEQIKENLIQHQNRGFTIKVDNNIVGDLNFGGSKSLEIHFLLDDKECILVGSENNNLIFQL
jgi:hypothetical protein